VVAKKAPYENERDNLLSTLSYIQVFLVMFCGLVLKTKDLSDDGFDKEYLGVILVLVNVTVLLTAVAFAVIHFLRSGEEDYQSDNAATMLKRGTRNLMGRKKKEKEMIEEGEIELGDIYKNKRDRGAEQVNNPLAAERGEIESESESSDSDSDSDDDSGKVRNPPQPPKPPPPPPLPK